MKIKIVLERRYILILLCFFNAVISYAAIIPMAKQYGWTAQKKGIVLSSFFYGYMCTQLIGGYLSHRFGGKRTLAISCGLWSFFTALTPLAASDFGWLIFVRILLGLSEGVGFPSIMAIVSKYVPPNEHSRAIAFILSGSYLGAVCAYLVSSHLIESPALGWPSVFYVFGFIGVFWIIPWILFEVPASNEAFSKLPSDDSELTDFVISNQHQPKLKTSNPATPEDMSRRNSSSTGVQSSEVNDSVDLLVPESRREFLNSSPHFQVKLDPTQTVKSQSFPNLSEFGVKPIHKSIGNVPWRTIMRCKEVWAIIIVQFCQSWSYWLLINWLPTYYDNVFHADIKHIGYFAIVPYIAQGISGILSGIFGDYLINRGCSKLFVRKFMQAFGMIVMSFFLILGVLVSTTIAEGMAYITVAMAIYCTTFAGVSVNHLDIAPNYAPIIYGIGNTAAQLPGIVGVWFTGLLLDVTHNNWLIVFSVSSTIAVTGAIAWLLMAGADVVIN